MPKATLDKVAAGMISAFAHGKARRETDKDAASELRNLARRVKLRTGGKPIDNRRPRFMLDMCDFGSGTLDPCTMPMFDPQGQLLLEHGETALWTGAGTAAAEAGQTYNGQEQFTTMWQTNERATFTLTDRRLVYDIRKYSRCGKSPAGDHRRGPDTARKPGQPHHGRRRVGALRRSGNRDGRTRRAAEATDPPPLHHRRPGRRHGTAMDPGRSDRSAGTTRAIA